VSVAGVTVVLVRTHNPGNLGAAARAARNFGAGLLLVAPFADRDHEDARAFSSGAEGLLDAAPLGRALADLADEFDDLVALTTMRGRVTRALPPRTTWPSLRRFAAARRLGLVFGPERGGLTTDELRLCGARLSLPSRPDFPTLNLAQSVAATLALLASGRVRPAAEGGAEEEEPRATAAELARVLARLRETLAAAGWPGKGHSREVLAEVESMLLRARPTKRETTLLLGALAALQRR
jgi:TrmH family RNA methyltransferase